VKTVSFDLEHFQYRLVRDAINEASAAYWLRRADEFEAARPQIGDFHGSASRENLRSRFERLTAIAEACRNRSRVCELTEVEDRLIGACIAGLEVAA
jgi:hypothetical protein